jgi:P4 family phage/plasmid primase-like protien
MTSTDAAANGAGLKVSTWLHSRCDTGRLAELLPEDLRAAARFSPWRGEPKVKADGTPKIDKVPMRAKGGKASTADSSTWCDFATAAAALEAARARCKRRNGTHPDDAPNALHGVSLQLLDGAVGQCMTARADRLWGVDLDRVLDEYSIAPIAEEILAAAGECYAEVSPSGTGLRILGRGGVPEALRDFDREVEFYMGDGGRHLTITGNIYGGHAAFGPMAPALAQKLAELAGVSRGTAPRTAGEEPPGGWQTVTASDPIEPGRLERLLCWIDPDAPNPKWFRLANAIVASTDRERAGVLARRWSRGELAALSREDRRELGRLFAWEVAGREEPFGWDEAAPEHLERIVSTSTAERNGRVAAGGSLVATAREAGWVEQWHVVQEDAADDALDTEPSDEPSCGPSADADEPALEEPAVDAAPEVTTETEEEALVRSFHLTDAGNAERFVQRHQEDVRFLHRWDRWHLWDGSRWAPDDRGVVVQLAIATARSIYREAEQPGLDPKAVDAITKHARGTEKRQQLGNMLFLAQSMDPLAVVPSDLDTNPDLLNVPNGTLDLRTGRLLQHERAHLITKCAGVPYDPAASAPLWHAFLADVIEDKDVRSYLARAVGYTLTGDVGEHALFFCHGGGSNGKSTFLETIRELLAEYARQAVPDLLIDTKQARHSTEFVDLKGARMVTAPEVKEGCTWDEVKVKQLTGGDAITGRPLYREAVEFQPTHKFWIAGNHKPRVRGTDLGFWRRVHLIPFTVTIAKEKRDRSLRAKLRTELPGILRWAVEGCVEWRRVGLDPPSAVVEATEEYRGGEDAVGAFIAECCVTGGACKVAVGAMHKAFVEWSGQNHLSTRRFGDMIEERGHPRVKGTGGVRQFQGVGLLKEDPPAQGVL